MNRGGRICVKLRPGVETRAPAHLDVLAGAARAAGTIDGGGRVDRAILARVTGMRARRQFHSRLGLHRVGERAAAYDDLEISLGLPDTLALELAEPDRAAEVVAELRLLEMIEWAMVEPLALAPLAAAAAAPEPAGHDSAAAFERVGATRALTIEPGSRAVPVAVIDTGVALEHVEFSGKLRSGFDAVDLGMGKIADGVTLVGDSLGRDFCARDETGHGSHVAGVIGAAGLGMPRGIAGASPIIPVRALAAALMGSGELVGVGGLSDIDAAIKIAVDLGAKVINMSFGTAGADLDPDAPGPHSDVLRYAEAHRVIPVAAMGNSGLEETYYPAALPQTIAVGSMALDGRVSEFSTSGPHIALCAPGEDVFSAGLDGYRESTGTSHAAPFVAGAAALLAARALSRGHDLTGAEAKQLLTASAEGAARGHDHGAGSGMLDIPAALRLLDQTDFHERETTP